MDPQRQEIKDQKFEKTLDKYYTNVDAEQNFKLDQEKFQQRLNEKISVNSLNFFHQQSSSYYKQSQQKFETEL
jgi:hypothetical protein